MLGEEIYVVRIIEGSLTDTSFLAGVPHEFKMEFGVPNWGRLIEAQLSMPQIREIQKKMIRHSDSKAPWYMEGYLAEDPNVIICAFGADDEEGGRTFIFERKNRESFRECVEYGKKQGIPEEQMDFL